MTYMLIVDGLIVYEGGYEACDVLARVLLRYGRYESEIRLLTVE